MDWVMESNYDWSFVRAAQQKFSYLVGQNGHKSYSKTMSIQALLL